MLAFGFFDSAENMWFRVVFCCFIFHNHLSEVIFAHLYHKRQWRLRLQFNYKLFTNYRILNNFHFNYIWLYELAMRKSY